MKMGKQGVAALALGIVSLITPAFASADGASDPTAVEITLTITYVPPTSWTTPFDGTVQLYTGTTGNLTPLGSPTTFSVAAGQTDTIAFPSGPVGGAPSGLQIFGSTVTVTATGSTVSYEIFAFPSGPVGGFPSAPPTIYTGMTDGNSVFTASGDLVANDSPEVVGTWTLTETPVASPEPATLSLALIALGFTGILARRKRFDE